MPLMLVCTLALLMLCICVGGLVQPVLIPLDTHYTGQGNTTRHVYAFNVSTAHLHYANAPLFRPGSGASPPGPVYLPGSVALSKYTFPSGNYTGQISRLFWRDFNSLGTFFGLSLSPSSLPEVSTLTDLEESILRSSERLNESDRLIRRRLREHSANQNSESVLRPFASKRVIDYILTIFLPHNHTHMAGGILGTSIISILGCMQAGNGVGGSNDQPPYWEPSMERTVPFRQYLSNLTLWCVGSEKSQQAQVSMIIRRLGGTARELADLLTPQEMFLGGVVEGIQLEPVAYLIQGLQRKFASLDEEARLRALLNMMRFTRKPGERVDELLARFDVIRTNARIEGQFVMSIEGYAVLLLSSLGVTHDNIAQTLAPLRGRLPSNEAQLEEITIYMRRMGHLSAHRPDNIADQLNHRNNDARFHFGNDGQARTPDSPLQSPN